MHKYAASMHLNNNVTKSLWNVLVKNLLYGGFNTKKKLWGQLGGWKPKSPEFSFQLKRLQENYRFRREFSNVVWGWFLTKSSKVSLEDYLKNSNKNRTPTKSKKKSNFAKKNKII